MYQLLIVEDEKWEREGLRDFLNWESMGVELAGCACNGMEGMKMAELYRPEIIITDIKMPNMDGIEMSENIRVFLPDTKIIILSGYNDFQYAKQSFGFHAFEYILKPIEKKALEEVAFRAVEVLDREKSMNGEKDAIKSQWMDYVGANRDHLLLDLLEGNAGLEYLSDIVPINGVDLQRKIVVAVLSFRGIFDDCNKKVMNEVAMMLNERGIMFSFNKYCKEAVICVNAPAAQSELEEELLRLINNLKEELDIEVIIGVGGVAEDFAGVSQSYSQAREASSFCFLAEYGELLFYNKIRETDFKDINKTRPLIIKSYGIIKKILNSARKCDMDGCSLLVDDFLLTLKEDGSISKMLLIRFFTEVMCGLDSVKTCDECNNSKEEVWDKNRFDTDLSTLDSISQTRQYMMNFLKRITAHTACMTGSTESEVTQKVIGIIEERYAEDLDLRCISEEIHLTPYYIGSIFKKHTKKQFNQYLNEYRIDKAKEMLQGRRIKVSQLANAVGIQNTSYFCLLFKNRFGISPGDYKDILKGGREYV